MAPHLIVQGSGAIRGVSQPEASALFSQVNHTRMAATSACTGLSRRTQRIHRRRRYGCNKGLNSNKGTKTLTEFFGTFCAGRTFGNSAAPKNRRLFSQPILGA